MTFAAIQARLFFQPQFEVPIDLLANNFTAFAGYLTTFLVIRIPDSPASEDVNLDEAQLSTPFSSPELAITR
jgi:hypothetical protein